MGPKGLSRLLIKPSGNTINAKSYLDECIQYRLISYICSNYDQDEYIFWLDQATSHYAKVVIKDLHKENINFVDKVDNPACQRPRSSVYRRFLVIS